MSNTIRDIQIDALMEVYMDSLRKKDLLMEGFLGFETMGDDYIQELYDEVILDGGSI